MKASHPKIHLKNGVCQPGAPSRGSTNMPKFTRPSKPPQQDSINEDKLLEIAKAMAKEMASEIINNMPKQQVVVQPGAGVVDSQDYDNIEIESSFIDPSESENFSVNLDNVESKTGESIKDKLAKLKKLKGDI